MSVLSAQVAVPFSVLLVDADEDRRADLIAAIEREDFDAITCRDVTEALEILDWHRCSVAVIAPAADGAPARADAAALRAKTPTLRVVLLGGSPPRPRRDAGGAWLHLVPADGEALAQMLHRLLSHCLLEALATREDRYRILLDTAGSVIVHLKQDLSIQDWNPAAETLTGYARSEVMGHDFPRRFLPEDQREAVRRALREVLSGEPRVGLEVNTLVRDGSPRTVIWNLNRLDNADGLPGVLAVGHDVTALRTSREELRRLAQHLQGVRDEERAHIAREIHDQLGQELTALKLHLSVLRTAIEDPAAEVAESLETMGELVVSTSETVRRISRELHPNPTAHMSLVSAIRWKVEESARRFGFKGRFVAKTKKVKLDRKRETHLIHILQEALTNVARHAEAETVEVELDVQDGAVVLTIADDGKGISEALIAERKSIGMTGMRERAHLCGGELTLFCAPGTGTIIIVRLPLDPEKADPRSGTIEVVS